MALSSGARLGPYEIVSAIGAGGMGEVYRARDTKLGRDVALKILPHLFAGDPDRLARFDREARAIAALNHPNIVTIYSVEQADGRPFLTMELVEGRTLADILPRGGMPLERLLRLVIALADAMAAAHDKGVTHRDLKPGNIMVTPDGRAKVLDFGLAKLREAPLEPAAATLTQTITSDGRIGGTVAYMSPEQAEGKPVDHRSDLFSVGIILYELATGQRPFMGDTTVSVLAAILKDTPPTITELNPGLPGELSRIVTRCLAKDPDRRYQTAKDLRNDLTLLNEETASGVQSATGSRAQAARGVRAAVASAMVLGMLLVGAYMMLQRPPSDAGAASASFTQLTFQSGMETFPSLSPDAKWIVYAGESSGNTDIYLQSVGGQNSINLTADSPPADTQPSFSPDGEHIAFRSERDSGGIFVMGRTGDSIRRLTRNGYTPAWSPDGREIAFSTADSGLTPYVQGAR